MYYSFTYLLELVAKYIVVFSIIFIPLYILLGEYGKPVVIALFILSASLAYLLVLF